MGLGSCKEEEYNRSFEAVEKNEEWFSSHFDEIKKDYEDMFLAIKDCKIIAASAEVEDLLKELEEKREDINSIFITSIMPRSVAFIL